MSTSEVLFISSYTQCGVLKDYLSGIKDFLTGEVWLPGLGRFLLGVHYVSLGLGVTVECTLLINTIPTFIPNSQSHFDLPPEPSFLRNPDLFPSRHVASRCSCPPSSQLPCSSAISPKLLSLLDNIYVGWGWHKEVINVAHAQTPWQLAEQMFSHVRSGFHLWALTMTAAFVGTVLICSCEDGGTLRFSVNWTLLHISIARGACTNPSAQANHRNN